jgi:hypothetical protein
MMACTLKTLARVALVGTMMSIVACAPREPTPMQPTDQARYNHDLSECQAQAASSFSFGNAVTQCMQARGYHVE